MTGRCFSRRRTSEFLKFMDEVAALHPSQEAHVILDNLSTHSGKDVNRWLSRHKNFTFHYTPVGCGVPELGHRSRPGILRGSLVFVDEAGENGLRCLERSAMGWWGRGGRSGRLRWGRRPL
jgi:DDE superfamily endonuclease